MSAVSDMPRSEPAEVPGHSAEASGELAPLARALGTLVLTVREAGNMVLLRTVPGGAPMVSAAIDRACIAPIVSTVAGNDTVLAVTRSVFAGGVMARYLRALALDGPEHRRHVEAPEKG
ncbi:MAG: arginine repressor [Georgenia sp.]